MEGMARVLSYVVGGCGECGLTWLGRLVGMQMTSPDWESGKLVPQDKLLTLWLLNAVGV